MSNSSIGWARRALDQQIEIFGSDQVSLDSLWRAVGCPAGHDPRRWSDLASPLLSGYSAYLDRLEGDADSTADPSRLVWFWKDGSQRPLAHRRPDERRVHRLGLRDLSRQRARQGNRSRRKLAGRLVKVAGAHGNRTHQEPVSRPLTGFEDRAAHQQRTRSRMMPGRARTRL